MRIITAFIMGAGLTALAACGGGDSVSLGKPRPEVTRIHVAKGDRVLYLLDGQKVVKKYPIHLGFAPEGHKQFEGDGKTPEGTYRIDRRNPNSRYYLSLGVSYPNRQDAAFAQSQGKQPGGDIFIHGIGRYDQSRLPKDWTAGCIAVDNDQIEEIYAMVKDGTVITIAP